MITLVILIPALFALAKYYYNTAKEFNKNKMGYAILGFFMPFFPMIVFVLFISIGHLILGHDPKFHLGKTLAMWGMFFYLIFVLGFPQYLKLRWSKTENSFENSSEILDQSI